MSKHTPGPWVVHEGQIITADGKEIITQVDGSTNEESVDDANARLIAQSPAMYDLLKRIYAEDSIKNEALHREIYDILIRLAE